MILSLEWSQFRDQILSWLNYRNMINREKLLEIIDDVGYNQDYFVISMQLQSRGDLRVGFLKDTSLRKGSRISSKSINWIKLLDLFNANNNFNNLNFKIYKNILYEESLSNIVTRSVIKNGKSFENGIAINNLICFNWWQKFKNNIKLNCYSDSFLANKLTIKTEQGIINMDLSDVKKIDKYFQKDYINGLKISNKVINQKLNHSDTLMRFTDSDETRRLIARVIFDQYKTFNTRIPGFKNNFPFMKFIETEFISKIKNHNDFEEFYNIIYPFLKSNDFNCNKLGIQFHHKAVVSNYMFLFDDCDFIKTYFKIPKDRILRIKDRIIIFNQLCVEHKTIVILPSLLHKKIHNLLGIWKDSSNAKDWFKKNSAEKLDLDFDLEIEIDKDLFVESILLIDKELEIKLSDMYKDYLMWLSSKENFIENVIKKINLLLHNIREYFQFQKQLIDLYAKREIPLHGKYSQDFLNKEIEILKTETLKIIQNYINSIENFYSLLKNSSSI